MKEIKMNNNCLFCGNKNLTHKKVQYIYKHNSEFIIVNDVPCLQCDFCGEQYFTGSVLEKIESLFFDIYDKKRKIQKMVQVPVESFTAV